MKKRSVAVLDVGSEKIRLMVGERGVNKTFVIKSSVDAQYDGYSDAVFYKPAELPRIIDALVNKAQSEIREKITSVCVGVPGEFIVSYCKEYKINFPKKKKITSEEVSKLYEAAFSAKSDKYKLITRSAIYYFLSGGRNVTEPKGLVSDSLGGNLTFYMCDVEFLKIFDKALKACGVTRVEYYPVSLAEVLYFFDNFERDKGGVLADVGYISSTVCYYSGDGILYEKSFSMGGGEITAELYGKFKIPFSAAEKLKRMINVSYNPYEEARYEVEDGGKIYSVPVSSANAAVKDALDRIAQNIAVFLDEVALPNTGSHALSLTGGGISYIRGAKEYVAARLGAVITTVAPDIPLFDKPANSSSFSLLDLALKNIEK
ncbi:MAG: hypothetical protein J6U35_01940 [Clostridia bacterium]|nr:hypothetical protein [Clostridia bacterium]